MVLTALARQHGQLGTRLSLDEYAEFWKSMQNIFFEYIPCRCLIICVSQIELSYMMQLRRGPYSAGYKPLK